MELLKRIDNVVAKALRIICYVCIGVLFLLLIWRVSVRIIIHWLTITMSSHWTDELVQWAFAWLAFFGAASLWRDNSHFRIEWLQTKLKGTAAGAIIGLLIELISLIFIVLLVVEGTMHTILANQWTPIFNYPQRIHYICLPIAGLIMFFYSIRNVVMQVSGMLKKKQS